MRRLGGRYTPPGPKGDPGPQGDPGVTTEPQPDGSLIIEPTGIDGIPAVAIPSPPDSEGTYRLVCVDGSLTYQEEATE